jgi:hypothetical protein
LPASSINCQQLKKRFTAYLVYKIRYQNTERVFLIIYKSAI